MDVPGSGQNTTRADASIAGTISSPLARLVLDVASEFVPSPDELRRLPGFASDALADDVARPPTDSLLQVWERYTAAQAGPAGLRMAEEAVLGRLHVWDYLFTSGPTLADGAREAARYLHLLVDPSASMEVVEDGRQLTIRYGSEAEWTSSASAIHEFLLALFLRRSQEAVGGPLVPVHVGFAHDKPTGYRALQESFQTPHIDFGEPANSITFLAADTPPAKPFDPALSRILRHYADIASQAARPVSGWYDRFQNALRRALHDGRVDLTSVAARLGVSPRTLQRELDRLGTTWQAELDAARRQRAEQLLHEPGRTRASIAAALGYSDTRSLRRALQRWNLP